MNNLLEIFSILNLRNKMYFLLVSLVKIEEALLQIILIISVFCLNFFSSLIRSQTFIL